MGPSKRKRSGELEEEDSVSELSFEEVASEDEVDISSSLTGKRAKVTLVGDDGDEGDEELSRLIKRTMAKRDIKDGTKQLKKTKGKGKITKGEVGGGSFQSMGTFNSLLSSKFIQVFSPFKLFNQGCTPHSCAP